MSRAGPKTRKKNVCVKCEAPCCTDLAMMITKPRNKTEIGELEWYLHFDTVTIYIRNYRWYLQIKGKCIYLGRNNLCKKYNKRSGKCRRHQPPDCERYGEWYDVLISNPDRLRQYLNKEGRRPRR